MMTLGLVGLVVDITVVVTEVGGVSLQQRWR